MSDRQIQCPECPAQITLPINVTIIDNDDGTQSILAEPDLTDMWAHLWTHTDSIGGVE